MRCSMATASDSENTPVHPGAGMLRLTDLAPEIHVHLFALLSWPSLTNLRLACTLFASYLTKEDLLVYHQKCCDATLLEEQSKLKAIETDYWYQAEQSFLGYHSSSYTSSSLDPDLTAWAQAKTCMAKELPCYHCLQWKPSRTDGEHFIRLSAFTRGRCTLAFDLGRSSAHKRVCIDCGVRAGIYPRGSTVKHDLICALCGQLSPVRERRGGWSWCDPRLDTWKKKYFCQQCMKSSEAIRNLTLQQFEHEIRWARYEVGMRNGKRYRDEKGSEVRHNLVHLVANSTNEHDVEKRENDAKVNLSSETTRQPNKVKDPRFCPVMQRTALCFCADRPKSHLTLSKTNLVAIVANNC